MASDDGLLEVPATHLQQQDLWESLDPLSPNVLTPPAGEDSESSGRLPAYGAVNIKVTMSEATMIM